MTQKDQKGSKITDTFTINLGHCVQARVVVYMYLIFVMTVQNISNDGDKGVQICISPTFIEPSVDQGMHQCWMHVSDTDRRNTQDCSADMCSTEGKRNYRRQTH